MNQSKKPTKQSFFYFYLIKNLKQSELAKKYDVSEKTISIWRKELSIPKKGHRNVAHPRFNPLKEEIEQLYTDLKSSRKVGNHYNKNASTILSCLRRYDVPIQQKITETTPWNKGLTKKTSEKVRLMSEKGANKRIGILIGDKNPAKRREVREKIGIANSKPWTKERKEKWMREVIPHHKGLFKKGHKKNTLKIRKQWSLKRRGVAVTDETKRKLSIRFSGKGNPMYGNPILERTTYRNTSIERKVKRELLKRGINHFLSNKLIHNCVMDIIFYKEKIAIECDGCYWHGCKKCKPWKNKKINDSRVLGNIKRGKKKNKILKKNDWILLRFWEHEINQDVKGCVDKIELYLLRKK